MQAERVIVKNEFVTLTYHEDTKIVHHTFHQYIYGEPFRDCLIKGLEVMKAHSAVKWLSDDRENMAIPREEREWVRDVWSMQAFEAGWKYWAVVLPLKMVGKMALNRMIHNPEIRKKLTVQDFDSADAAYGWLVRQ